MGKYNSLGLNGKVLLNSNYDDAFKFNNKNGGIVLDEKLSLECFNKMRQDNVDIDLLKAKLIPQIK